MTSEAELETLFARLLEKARVQQRAIFPYANDEEIEIRTEGRLCSPVRMEFHYDVVLKSSDARAASGRTLHAALGLDGKPCRLPNRVREAFA